MSRLAGLAAAAALGLAAYCAYSYWGTGEMGQGKPEQFEDIDEVWPGDISAKRPDGRIVMLYSDILGLPLGRFNATKWFKDGMYRTVGSENTMYRASVPPLPDSQLEKLRYFIATEFDPTGRPTFLNKWGPPPQDYKEILMDKRFDPRPQMIYDYSFFEGIDEPVDSYTVYLLIGGKRYYVMITRYGVTGKLKGAERHFMPPSVSEEREDWLFGQLEERQKNPPPPSKDTDFPMAVYEGERCPKTGLWWGGYGKVERLIQKGDFMPKIENEGPIWYRMQEQEPVPPPKPVTLEDIMSGKLPPEPAPPAEAAVPAAALATTAPSPAIPPRLATGEKCPKTGPWRCVEDGKTFTVTAGQGMPEALFMKPATGLLNRLRGIKQVYSHAGPGHWEWAGPPE